MAAEVIETERLRLVQWSEQHLPLLTRLSSIPQVMQYIGSGQTWSSDTARGIGEKQRRHWDEHQFGWRAAVEKETGREVGFIALNFVGDGTVDLDPCEYEVGWWLEPATWGQGLAREGAEALCDEAFARLTALSVVARIQPENKRSIRVAQRLGLDFDFETTGSAGETVWVYRRPAAGC
jgi:RimJ/RimL family protein N-acetyltransferase